VVAGLAQVRTAESPLEIAAVTRMIDVEGYPIRVRTAGLEARKQGQPVIIFESGGATPLETWDRILPVVIRFAPIVAYDRAGIGKSPSDGLPPTPERVGTRLSRLPGELKVEPDGRTFVGRSHCSLLRGQSLDRSRRCFVSRPDRHHSYDGRPHLNVRLHWRWEKGYEAFNRMQDQAMVAAPAPLRAEAVVVNNILRSEIEHRALPSAPRIPTSVIVAGRVAVPPGNLLPFDAKAYADAMHKSQVSRLQPGL